MRNVLLAVLAVTVAGLFSPPAAAEDKSIIVQSTTSTANSGLYDYLLPKFKQASGITVRVVAVGTGQAIAYGPCFCCRHLLYSALCQGGVSETTRSPVVDPLSVHFAPLAWSPQEGASFTRPARPAQRACRVLLNSCAWRIATCRRVRSRN